VPPASNRSAGCVEATRHTGGHWGAAGRRPWALLALATPAALDVGCMGARRGLDTKDVYGPLRVTDADGGHHGGPPGWLFSALGALRGTVVAKRV